LKPRRFHRQLSEEQQLILGLVLVILVAISMLYCLGIASLALREAWESGPLPWEEASPAIETLTVTSNPTVQVPSQGTSRP
jgi:hypothetical protein